MSQYSLQSIIFFSVNYLLFIMLCFGVLAFPAPIKEGFKLQLILIVVVGIILIATAFIK
jgi:hypothetical protein